MTDLDLQNEIIRELTEMTKEHSLKKLDGEAWKDYNIYRQEKPYKYDETYADDEIVQQDDQEDYLIVMIDDEDTDEEGRWLVTVHIIISVMLMEDAHQGNIILADLMNQIDLHFAEKGIIAGKYEFQNRNKHKRFNNDCYPNYYECDYITQWKLPEYHRKGLEEFT